MGGDLDTHFHLSNGKNFRLAQHLVLCTVGESYYRIHYIRKENLSATSSIWIAVISTCCSIPRLSLKPLHSHSSLTWTKMKLARIKITKTIERIFMKLYRNLAFTSDYDIFTTTTDTRTEPRAKASWHIDRSVVMHGALWPQSSYRARGLSTYYAL